MAFLSREQIIAAVDRRYVEVEVPEWGGTVRLQSLDAEQALKHEALVTRREKGDAKVNPLAALVVASVVDQDGKPLFTEKDMTDLNRKHPAVLVRLAKEINKMNGMDDPSQGNSKGSPAAD